MTKTHHCAGCKERQDRIDELEAELERTKIFAEEAEKVNSECLAHQHDQIAAMKAAGDELRSYARHKKDCPAAVMVMRSHPSCKCSRNKALAAWSAANGH